MIKLYQEQNKLSIIGLRIQDASECRKDTTWWLHLASWNLLDSRLSLAENSRWSKVWHYPMNLSRLKIRNNENAFEAGLNDIDSHKQKCVYIS